MAVERLSTTQANGTTLPGSWASSFGGGTGAISVQGNAIQMTTPAVGGYASSVRVWYLKPYWDFDMRVRAIPAAAWTTESFICVGVGAVFSTAENQPDNGVDVNLGGNTNAFSVSQQIGAVNTDVAAPGYTFTGSVPVKLRIRRVGITIYGKIWDDTAGVVEPSAWTGSAPITGPLTSSPLYPFIAVNTGSAATAITHSFDNIFLDNLRPLAIVTTPPSAGVSTDNLLNPGLDVSNAGLWTTNTGATTGLYQAIDEDTFDDADYIQSPVGP